MSRPRDDVYARLDSLGIPYRTARHAPAFTMQDCAQVDRLLGALTVKNIFLTTRNGSRFYLCITRPDARFRTSDISKQAGSPRLSFAPEEKLYEMLHAHGGSANPLGLIFDGQNRVKLLADSRLRDAAVLAFHPCDNTETIAMAASDFFDRFLPAVGHPPQFVEIHDFLNGTPDGGPLKEEKE